MGASGQFHALVALPPKFEPPLPVLFEQEAWRAADPVRTRWRKRNPIIAAARNRTPVVRPVVFVCLLTELPRVFWSVYVFCWSYIIPIFSWTV